MTKLDIKLLQLPKFDSIKDSKLIIIIDSLRKQKGHTYGLSNKYK